jgi:hypothetical protein
MVLLDQMNMYAARTGRRLFTIAGGTHKAVDVNHSVDMPILLSLSVSCTVYSRIIQLNVLCDSNLAGCTIAV